tara:strand:+ start:159 stop:449 length:291 start_codon:yes stop_codon:yes gene_type:complete
LNIETMMMTLIIAKTRGRHHRRRHRDSDSETPDARRRRMNENAPRSLANERVARATLTSPMMRSFFIISSPGERKEYSTFRIIVHVDGTKRLKVRY